MSNCRKNNLHQLYTKGITIWYCLFGFVVISFAIHCLCWLVSLDSLCSRISCPPTSWSFAVYIPRSLLPPTKQDTLYCVLIVHMEAQVCKRLSWKLSGKTWMSQFVWRTLSDNIALDKRKSSWSCFWTRLVNRSDKSSTFLRRKTRRLNEVFRFSGGAWFRFTGKVFVEIYFWTNENASRAQISGEENRQKRLNLKQNCALTCEMSLKSCDTSSIPPW